MLRRTELRRSLPVRLDAVKRALQDGGASRRIDGSAQARRGAFAVLHVGRSGTQFKNDFAVIGRQAALPRPGTRVPSPSSLPPSGNCQASRTRVPPCRAGREPDYLKFLIQEARIVFRAPGGLQEPGRRARFGLHSDVKTENFRVEKKAWPLSVQEARPPAVVAVVVGRAVVEERIREPLDDGSIVAHHEPSDAEPC